MSKLSRKKYKTKLKVQDIAESNPVVITTGQIVKNGPKFLFFTGCLVIDQEDALALAEFITLKFGSKIL